MDQHRHRWRLLLWLLALVIAAGPLVAQYGAGQAAGNRGHPASPAFNYPTDGYQRPGDRRRLRRQGRQGRIPRSPRDRERLNTIKMWKLTEFLELSEQQAEKFFPRHRSQQQEIDTIQEKRRELNDEFHRKISEGEVKERDIDRFLEEVSRLDRSRIDLRARRSAEMKDVLTVEQRAKFVVFDDYFVRQIRRGLGRDMPPDQVPDMMDRDR